MNNKKIYSAVTGNNSSLMANVAKLYFSDGMKIADVTYGKGVFWKNIDTSRYKLTRSDILGHGDILKHDFRRLPYKSNSFDAVVFDPPYMHNPGKPIVDANYKNSDTSSKMYHVDIINEFYRRGMSECVRITKSEGMIIVKCADEIESGCQCRGHIEVWEIGVRELDLIDKDLFLLVNSGGSVRNKQQHSKKNVSYMWVFIKPGASTRRPKRNRCLSR